jgi:Family of unknown function (DUF5824)
MKWPKRYFSGLTPSQKLMREKELLKRRRVAHPTLGPSNKFAKKRKSSWTVLFHKTYPTLRFNKNLIAKKTGIPRWKLNTVYDRGLKAWKTGGSRPGATAQQWAIARLYKFVLITKGKAATKRVDPNSDLRRKFRP